MGKKRARLHGQVKKIIAPIVPGKPEKVEIIIPEAEELYQEVRVDNILTDKTGNEVSLKPGADVDVVVEADSSATLKKP